ncbi:MAG: hypothetical protein M3R59_00915 [Verrucomicrobiota bacterium]|nr:hypothetical protein [Verrucomicrobiota bacterium]
MNAEARNPAVVREARRTGTLRGAPGILAIGLTVYAIAVAIFSYLQRDYINSDFVAYATIAERVWHAPATSVSASWSPLFSWFMAPMLAAGIAERVAGRLVLILAGAIYVIAVHRFSHGLRQTSRLVVATTTFCAVLHATLWATYLLDPDLIAAAFIFCYFLTLQTQRTRWHFAGGLAAALAYLAKAYLLPFFLVHVAISAVMRVISWRAMAVSLAGFFLLAAPWVGILSARQGHLVYSTAAASNYANVSPENFGHDPLWNPPLGRDYILHFSLSPSWSPFQDPAHFWHQVQLSLKNLFDCVAQTIGWVGLAAVAFFARVFHLRRGGKFGAGRDGRSERWWLLVTVGVFAGGYLLVQVQPRYVVPVIAPCLCALSFILLEPVLRGFGRTALSATALLLAASAQDGYRLAQIAIRHPQSHSVSHYEDVFGRTGEVVALTGPLACNRWHEGLIFSFIFYRLPDYLGAPLPGTDAQMQEQLRRAGARLYLREVNRARDPRSVSVVDRFIPAAPWKKALTLHDPTRPSREIVFYELPDDAASQFDPALRQR